MIFADYQSFVMLTPLFSIYTLIALMVAAISNYKARDYPSANMLIQSVFLVIGVLWLVEWLFGVYRTIQVAQAGAHVLPSAQEPAVLALFIWVYLSPLVFSLLAMSYFSKALHQIRRPMTI